MTIVDLLAPSLGKALAADERQRLSTLASRLPCPRGGGFEIRLAPGAPQTDLQINLQRGDSNSRAWVESLTTSPAGALWRSVIAGERLTAFLSAWSAGQPETAGIEELWLELDPDAQETAPPSLFLGFPQYWNARHHVRQVMGDWLPRLGKYSVNDARTCERCLAAVPDGAFLSHVGLMLSRPAHPIRLNIKRLFADRIPAFLKSAGWHGDGLALADLLFRIQRLETPRITLCLDVQDGAILPGLALEIGFLAQPPAAWPQLFETLKAHAAADPDKTAALLAWPGWTTPATEVRGWPFELIREGLFLPDHQFIGIQKRLSHAKIGVRDDGRLEAKAYAWFAVGTIGGTSAAEARASMPYEAWSPARAHRTTAEMSRDFFEHTTDATFDHYGATFQGWLIDAQGDMTASNRTIAVRAGIRDGVRVLDAGCGVCGPAIDIAGTWDVEIDAVTNVPRQVEIARRLVHEAGAARRIRVTLADFHDLPFPDASFDLILFLESSTSTDDLPRLLREAHRVLKPAGRLYLKSMFSPPADRMSETDAREMAEANRSQAGTAPMVADVVAALQACGFRDVVSEDLSGRANGDRWHEALLATGARGELSSLGATFRMRALRSHWFCADIRAVRP